ncbi:hypothetical protein ACSSS7_003960 [Eimeria intestinalis]
MAAAATAAATAASFLLGSPAGGSRSEPVWCSYGTACFPLSPSSSRVIGASVVCCCLRLVAVSARSGASSPQSAGSPEGTLAFIVSPPQASLPEEAGGHALSLRPPQHTDPAAAAAAAALAALAALAAAALLTEGTTAAERYSSSSSSSNSSSSSSKMELLPGTETLGYEGTSTAGATFTRGTATLAGTAAPPTGAGLIIPSAYGWVLMVLLLAVCLSVFLTYNVIRARIRFGVKPPDFYAVKGDPPALPQQQQQRNSSNSTIAATATATGAGAQERHQQQQQQQHDSSSSNRSSRMSLLR